MAPAMSEISNATEDDPSRCANCGTPLHGFYCAACGQRKLGLGHLAALVVTMLATLAVTAFTV
jgi:hypothetical protein